jgi:hypothetical protein
MEVKQYIRYPSGAKMYQRDVETVYRLLEGAFFQIESFYSMEDFLKKAISGQRATSGYQLFFNVARKNSYKRSLSPLEIIKEKRPGIDPTVVLLPPVFFYELLNQKLKEKDQGGYHVPSHPTIYSIIFLKAIISNGRAYKNNLPGFA